MSIMQTSNGNNIHTLRKWNTPMSRNHTMRIVSTQSEMTEESSDSYCSLSENDNFYCILSTIKCDDHNNPVNNVEIDKNDRLLSVIVHIALFMGFTSNCWIIISTPWISAFISKIFNYSINFVSLIIFYLFSAISVIVNIQLYYRIWKYKINHQFNLVYNHYSDNNSTSVVHQQQNHHFESVLSDNVEMNYGSICHK